MPASAGAAWSKSIAIGVALCLLVCAGAVTKAESSDPAQVRLKASNRRPRVGVLLTVTVQIRGARDVGSVPFTLQFDPAILEYVPGGAREGGFLGKDGAETSFLTAAGASPGGGVGVVVGLSRLGGGPGARGRGTLCRLTFRAKAPGAGRLSFARARVLDPSAAPIPATFQEALVTVRPAR